MQGTSYVPKVFFRVFMHTKWYGTTGQIIEEFRVPPGKRMRCFCVAFCMRCIRAFKSI